MTDKILSDGSRIKSRRIIYELADKAGEYAIIKNDGTLVPLHKVRNSKNDICLMEGPNCIGMIFQPS